MKIKDIIEQSKINWRKVINSDPALKPQGQKVFTWENYHRLQKEAKDYDNQNIKLNDKKNVKGEKE